MKKFLVLSMLSLIGLTCVALLPQAAYGQKGKFRRSAAGIKDRYIVVLNEKFVDSSAVEPTIASEAGYLTAQFGGAVKGVYAHALKGFVIELPERAAIALSKNERVAYVEQDAEVTTSASTSNWGLDRIDQRALPLDGQYSYSTGASNVHAYIIDSGILTTHAEFGGRASVDFDVINDGLQDCHGHGTHVAGTVGGATYGVAKNIRLHGVRVVPCSGSGTVSGLIAGIDWVTANRIRPAVANISLTISTYSLATDAAVQNSINSGVTYAIAAGNFNLDACNYSPARAPQAITVGAMNSNDARAGYSNFGSCVDVWAPGTSILSASNANNTDGRWMSGTSMAAPHIAGVAALYLAANTTASPASVANAIINTSTVGAVTGLDPVSPNRLPYSWFSSGPPTPAPARVAIRKRTSRAAETATSFPYDAANLASSSFTLLPDNEFVDPSVAVAGASSTITVTEAPVLGWTLTSISCVETSGGGMPNLVNTTVDLANRRANIVAEQGEQIECEFLSEPTAPTVASANVTGRVVTPDGRGVRGVVVSILDADTGVVTNVTTNSFGYYAFRDLTVPHFFVVTAISNRKAKIRDNVRTFTLNQDLAGLDFRTGQ